MKKLMNRSLAFFLAFVMIISTAVPAFAEGEEVSPESFAAQPADAVEEPVAEAESQELLTPEPGQAGVLEEPVPDQTDLLEEATMEASLNEDDFDERFTITFDTGNIDECWFMGLDDYERAIKVTTVSYSIIIGISDSQLGDYFPIDEVYTLPGINFLGWAAEPGGEVIDLNDWSSKQDHTFYAVYEYKETCQITLHGHGGVFPQHDNADTITVSVVAGEPIHKALKDGPRYAFADEDMPLHTNESLTLDYWSTDAAGEERVNFETYAPAEGNELYAQWGEAAHLTFIVEEEVFEVPHVVTDEIVLDDETFYYVGFNYRISDYSWKELIGWRLEGEEEVYPSDTYTFPEGVREATFYAVFGDVEESETTYAWVFHSGDGSWEDTDDESIYITIKEGGLAPELPMLNPPEGRKFLFWKDIEDPDPYHEYEIDLEDETAAYDRNLWPQFSDYTITFDANGGWFDDGEDSEIYEQYVVEGEHFNEDGFVENSCLTPPEGKVFVGWADSEGSFEAYEDYLTNGAQSNATFYAQYEDAISITLTLKCNNDIGYYMVYDDEEGEDVAQPEATYLYVSDHQLTADEIKPQPRFNPDAEADRNRVFAYWSSDPEGYERIDFDSFDPDGDTVIYGQPGYAVNLIYDNEYTDIKAAEGETIDPMAFSGYEVGDDYYGRPLAGWSLTPDGEIVEELLLDADVISYTDDYVDGVVWFYPVYGDDDEPDGVTITFDANGGWFESGLWNEETEKYELVQEETYVEWEEAGMYFENISKPLPHAEAGHCFNGWRIGSPDGPIVDDGYELEDDITLYADWIESVTVTLVIDSDKGCLYQTVFNEDDGSFDEEPVSTISVQMPVDSSIDDISEVINWPTAYDGYLFRGWSLSSDAETLIDWEYIFTEDVTLYAYLPEAVTITLDANGSGNFGYNEVYDEEAEDYVEVPQLTTSLTTEKARYSGATIWRGCRPDRLFSTGQQIPREKSLSRRERLSMKISLCMPSAERAIRSRLMPARGVSTMRGMKKATNGPITIDI